MDSFGRLLFRMMLISSQLLLLSLICSAKLTVGTQQTNASASTDQEWKDQILQIPNALYLLSRSMVIAGRLDVSLTRLSPGIQFDLVKYPDSMRATLLQISNGKLR